MITFPCAKINLGLNITSRRPDGYHNLETVFYPFPLCDALEISPMDERFPSDTPCDLKITGNQIEGSEADNLVVKAYRLLAKDFELPRIHVHLFKNIPSQAGLGGGSSDAAAMIRLIDEHFRLNIGIPEMERYAARLGADCPFFITAEPAFATGIGDILQPADNQHGSLAGYHIAVVKPDIAVSTKEAYGKIIPQQPELSCRDIVKLPISEWKNLLTNDFETPAFEAHPTLNAIKEQLYDMGAHYAQMSGSGSALFGLFSEAPQGLKKRFPDCFVFSSQL